MLVPNDVGNFCHELCTNALTVMAQNGLSFDPHHYHYQLHYHPVGPAKHVPLCKDML